MGAWVTAQIENQRDCDWASHASTPQIAVERRNEFVLQVRLTGVKESILMFCPHMLRLSQERCLEVPQTPARVRFVSNRYRTSASVHPWPPPVNSFCCSLLEQGQRMFTYHISTWHARHIGAALLRGHNLGGMLIIFYFVDTFWPIIPIGQWQNVYLPKRTQLIPSG